jgi:SPP1 family predicted phage head-tail adaptor
MQIGKLDQWITLKRPTESSVSGSVTKSYSSVANVCAHIISEKGSEAFESARVNARERMRVMIRYRNDVTTAWQVVWLGQTYNIIVVDRSQHRVGELWLTTELVGAA